MKRMSLPVLLLSLACVVGPLGLAGCGGPSADSSASTGSAANTEAASDKTDEQLIAEDVEKVIGVAISKDELLDDLRSDEEYLNYEKLGFDLDAYAEHMSNIFSSEVSSVVVTGDTAVATVTITVPDYGDAASDLMDQKLEGVDTTGMDEEQLIVAYMTAMSKAFADPDYPTQTTELEVDYVKRDGVWTMKDEGEVEAAMEGAINAAAGL